jgi:transcriptional regulator with XRE-family HTH domain
VTPSISRTRLEGFARRVEAADNLPDGAAYQTVHVMYREGGSLREVAGKLHMASRSTSLILDRLGQPRRPWWCREAFRDAEGHHLDPRQFGATLKALRRSLGLSQKRLGQACGISQQAVSELERGKEAPLWETLEKLVEGLGVSFEFFGVTWGPVPTPSPGPVTCTAQQEETTLTSYPYDTPSPGEPEQQPDRPAEAAEFRYDSLDRLAQVIDPITPSWINFAYDTGPVRTPSPAVEATRVTLAPEPTVYREAGALTTFSYDPIGRCPDDDPPPGNPAAGIDPRYVYDMGHRPAQAEPMPVAGLRYQYDTIRRPSEPPAVDPPDGGDT